MSSSLDGTEPEHVLSPEDDDFQSAHSASPPPVPMETPGASALALIPEAEGVLTVDSETEGQVDEIWDAEEETDDDDWDGGTDEYELEDEEEDDDEDADADVDLFFGRAANTVHSRAINQLPLIKDHVPEPMTNELADELTMRTAPVGLRTIGTGAGAPRRTTSNAEGEGEGAPPLMRNTTLSPTRALLLREIQPGGSGMGAHRRAAGHIAAFHRLPTKPMNIVDRMQSRAYIGRFTSDGDLFVAGFQNERRIRMYDVHNNWKVVKDVHARNLRWTITDIALSSDQNYLLYASITPVVNLVNVRRGEGGTGATQSIANITDVHEALDFGGESNTRSNGIWSLRWSPDNTEIIAGTADASLYIYDIAAGRTVVRVQGHSDDVNAVAYADETSGNLIFTGSDDHEVKVWDRRTLGQRRGAPVVVFIGHTEGVAHLDAKGDGRYVISNSKDQSIKLWDVRMARTPKEASTAKSEHRGNIPSFNWDYRWMAYPASGRVVSHPADGAVSTYRGHAVLSTLCRAYWSPGATTGQRYIYVASSCGSVVIYDVISCMEVARLRYHREIVRDCSWHPHLPLLATASFDGCVVTWEPQVQGDDEAEAEEVEARKAAAGNTNERKRREGRGGPSRIGRGLPVPGQDQLGDWW